MSRLPIRIEDADSDTNMTAAYLKANYTQKINDLDPEDEFYLEDLEDYLRCLDLGMFMIKQRDFKFDGMDELQAIYDKQSNMLNQRVFTVLLKNANGRKDEMIDGIKDAGLLEPSTKMLLNILSRYSEPTFEELLKDYKIEVKKPIAEPVKEVEDEEEFYEDDEDLFGSGSGATGAPKVKSPVDVKSAILDAISRL
jgi:hypothetical protein